MKTIKGHTINKKTGAKKRGKKCQYVHSFCHRCEYYMNKLGKLKLPNHVKKLENYEAD